MDPNTMTPGTDPTDNDLQSEAHGKMAEAYRKQSETEADPGLKAQYSKMAERHAKMGEAFAPAAGAAPPAPAGPAAPPAPPHHAGFPPSAQSTQAEDEAKKEAEAKKQAEAKQATAEDKYLNLLTQTLLKESGVSPAEASYLQTVVLEGERDEAKIKAKIGSYMAIKLQESNRGGGHNGPKTPTGTHQVGVGTKELRDSSAVAKLIRLAKGA